MSDAAGQLNSALAITSFVQGKGRLNYAGRALPLEMAWFNSYSMSPTGFLLGRFPETT